MRKIVMHVNVPIAPEEPGTHLIHLPGARVQLVNGTWIAIAMVEYQRGSWKFWSPDAIDGTSPTMGEDVTLLEIPMGISVPPVFFNPPFEVKSVPRAAGPRWQ
jgi:hypothetical protein